MKDFGLLKRLYSVRRVDILARMIGIGIIGCGHWGPNYIRNFSIQPNVKVQVAADTDPKRRALVEGLFSGLKTVASHRELLSDPRVQAVVVATPTSTHHAIVKEALQAGKDVLCEKPLTVTAAESEELALLARKTGRILMVGHTFLFNPGILKLKSLIDEGTIGSVYYMHAERTNLGPIRTDVSVVHDLASHDISIFNFLRGTLPETVNGKGGRFLRDGIDDVAFVTLQYPGNVIASLIVSWLHPRKVREVTVVGDRKMIIWNDLGTLGPIMIFDKSVKREPAYLDFGEFNLLAREGDVTIPRVALTEPLKLQTEHFISCLLARSQPRTSVQQGIDVARVLDAINLSIAQGGIPCPVKTE